MACRTVCWLVGMSVLGGASVGASPRPAPASAVEAVDFTADPGALILTVGLPNPDEQIAPFPLWVRPDTGLMIEFPFPVVAVQGRKARVVRTETDPNNAAAEWIVVPHRIPKTVTDIADVPPPFTLWVSPQFEPTECVLHVTLGDGKVYTFQFYTPLHVETPKDEASQKVATEQGKGSKVPTRQVAYARVRFRAPVDASDIEADASASNPSTTPGRDGRRGDRPSTAAGAAALLPPVVRSEDPPEADLEPLTPEGELGLLDFVRLLQALPEERALATAQANPVVQSVMRGADPSDVGTFGQSHTVRLLWVCRDTTSGAMAFGLSVENRTPFALTFDPSSWAVRVGHGAVYRATAARGARFVAPGATEFAQIVIARDANGDPLRIDPARNSYTPSVALVSTKSARPFHSLDVPAAP